MSKKIRTILFLICLFLFFLTTPLIILYSQGYRFDFENKKLTQTGGFFLKAEPKQVEIYIDGKLAEKTDFFFGSALVENLLPKKYKIEVKKDGYLTWEKNLEIREKQVTEVKNIILFPKNTNFAILTEGTERFWFSPDEKKIILLEIEKDGESWALKLYDLERNIKSHLISKVDINQDEAKLLNLEFSDDSREIYLDIGLKEQEKTFILRLDKLPPQLIEKEIAPFPENILASQKQNQDVYYLDNSGYVFKNEVKLNEIFFPVQPDVKYALEIFPNFIFLREGQALYLFSPESKSFENFFDRAKDLKISPDGKKLTFFSSSEIWILFLLAEASPHLALRSASPSSEIDEGTKKAGEKLFLVRLSEKINDVFWLNSDYLILNSGNNLIIIETDDRDKIQTWRIAATPNFTAVTEIYFNRNYKKLYILSEGNLFVSEKLF